MAETIPHPVTIDFETFPIEARPAYPPIPVGVSIKPWGKKARYLAWGHPTKNNCSWGEGQNALAHAWLDAGKDGLLFQNGKFDVDVAQTHMAMPVKNKWQHFHDTLFLLFLDDPHQKDLGLKPSSERLLGMKPEEQDAVVAWLLKHQPLAHRGIKMSPSRQSDNFAGKYVAYAPGDLVGKYADGDTTRTERLFKLLWPKTRDRGMLGAYDRERELMLNLLDMERQGLPIDIKRLRSDVAMYQKERQRLEGWIYKRLGVGDDLNLNSGQALVSAMEAAGVVDMAALGVTEKTGRPKTDKESLLGAVSDLSLLAALKWRTQLGTCLHTFMEPWLATAERGGRKIFTTWNQVKGSEGKGNVGTRTGRLSSTPNFQNIPKAFQPVFKHEGPKGNKLPKAPIQGLPALPLVRSYVVPWQKGHVLIDRDYSQQELRILAHFAGGSLADAYEVDKWVDIHEYVRQLVNKMTGKSFERKPIKNTNFGLIYGMGIGLLAEKSGITVELAKEVKEAILAVIPGIKLMYQEMRRRMMSNEPIRTWGGREYFCEAPKMVDGRMMTFDYKLVNYLVQGSASDCSKDAVNEWYRKRPSLEHRLFALVHDEELASCPRAEMARGMEHMRTSMEHVVFDVPMLSEGSWSPSNWSDLKDHDKAGRKVWRGK